MPSLRELQRAFAQALLSGDSRAIEPHVIANGLEPAARLRIYYRNARETFLGTLRAEYPVLERLVGEDYFRQLAFEYRSHHTSPSGNLHHVGEMLPQFLAQRFKDGEYAYFPDVARLEWAYQEVLVAADHAPLAVERLQRVAPERYGDLVFRLHPAARLVSSPYPVLTIWSANQPGADSSRIIDLGSAAERVLLLRTAHDVELRRLDGADFTFLSSIAHGASLAEALARAGEAGEIDAGAALRRYVAACVLIDFNLPPGEPT